jgi:hypothetical protein
VALRGVGPGRPLRQHPPALEIELCDLIEHVISQLDQRAGFAGDVDLLRVVDETRQIPDERDPQLPVAAVRLVAVIQTTQGS